jgi:hypothetical protein
MSHTRKPSWDLYTRRQKREDTHSTKASQPILDNQKSKASHARGDNQNFKASQNR